MHNNRTVRRQDRLLDTDGQQLLLETGEYGVLSMIGTDEYGYGIPISYVLSGESIYFHCAPEGVKLDNLKQNNRVSFCVVGKTRVIPGQFTTEYSSVMAFGTIEMELSDEEKYEALMLLAKKYSYDFLNVADKYIKGSFKRTQVLRLDIEQCTGKAKVVKEPTN